MLKVYQNNLDSIQCWAYGSYVGNSTEDCSALQRT